MDWAEKAVSVAFIFQFSFGFAQSYTPIETVNTPPAVAYSTDRRGDFYLGFGNGTLARYNSSGKELLNYSPQRLGEISLADAWNPLRIFLFYREFQTIVVLDRFLVATASYELGTQQQMGFISMACPSLDDTFWLIDDSYKGLVKYDPYSRQLVLKIPFGEAVPAESQVLYMREYQNLVFLSASDGHIYYFDNMGVYRGRIETTAPVSWFGFVKNEIYFLQSGKVRYIDLYQGQIRDLSLPAAYEAVLDNEQVKLGIKKEGGFDLLR